MSQYLLIPIVWISSSFVCFWTLHYNWPKGNKWLFVVVAIFAPPLIFVVQFSHR